MEELDAARLFRTCLLQRDLRRSSLLLLTVTFLVLPQCVYGGHGHSHGHSSHGHEDEEEHGHSHGHGAHRGDVDSAASLSAYKIGDMLSIIAVKASKAACRRARMLIYIA